MSVAAEIRNPTFRKQGERSTSRPQRGPFQNWFFATLDIEHFRSLAVLEHDAKKDPS